MNLTLRHSALLIKNFGVDISGGIIFGGSSPNSHSINGTDQASLGGIVFGGSISETGFHYNVLPQYPSGGIVFGGLSPISTGPAWEIIAPSGGIVFGGSSPFYGHTYEGRILVEITLNGIVNYVSTEGFGLIHNWRPRIINISGPTYSIPSDHGGFAKMVFGNITFNPELFRDYWPPPVSAHIEFYYTDSTYAARELIFKGTTHIYSYDRVGITYAIYGPIYDDLVPDSTAYTGSLNETIASILTLIPEITALDTSLARDPSPSVNYTSTGDNVLAINLASDIAEFFTHLFYIIGTTAYLVDMLADNGVKDLTNEFKFLAYPKYKHKAPIAVLSAGEFSQSSDYPYGSESSVTPYSDDETTIETALSNILAIENAPRINFDAPLIHNNFLLHGQRVNLFDSANVLDLSSWMRVRKIQYDFNQWKINFEGEATILSGEEVSPDEGPFCLKLIAETESLSSSPQATPTNKIVYKDGKIYALANSGATGNAHGYVIDAITMEILSTVDYGSDIDSFGGTTGMYGGLTWASDLNRFITVGICGVHAYIFELDENLAITRKAFPGRAILGSDNQIYGKKGSADAHYTSNMYPITGAIWDDWFALIDVDAEYTLIPSGIAWNGIGTDPQVTYLDGYYIISRYVSGYFCFSYVINRDTLIYQGAYTSMAHYPIVYGDKSYSVTGSGLSGGLIEIDPNLPYPATTTRSLSISGYMSKPYAYDGFIYVSGGPWPPTTSRTIYKVDMATFTVSASYTDANPYAPGEAVMGADGRLYVACENTFVVLDPSDMTLICKYPLHGAYGVVSDGARYIYGAEEGSGKIQKYLPGGFSNQSLPESDPLGIYPPPPVLTPGPPSTTGPAITSPTVLSEGAGQLWPGTTLGAGQKKYYTFTVSTGLRYFRISLVSYDQQLGGPINMVVEKGPAIDYFDVVYNYYNSGNLAWGNTYLSIINGTQVWAEMNNDPFMQHVIVSNPLPGTYYVVIKTTNNNHISMQYIAAV